MAIKAIETVYNGYRFRSRLEARWAVFFDALNIGYDYEPEGFEFDDGVRYLPDFRLKCDSDAFEVWCEVKPELPSNDQLLMYHRFNNEHRDRVLMSVFLVLIGVPGEKRIFQLMSHKIDETSTWAPAQFSYSKKLERLGITLFEIEADKILSTAVLGFERDDRRYKNSKANIDEISLGLIVDSSFDVRHKSIRRAYARARQARFEHGDKAS